MILHQDSNNFLKQAIDVVTKLGTPHSDVYVLGSTKTDCLIYEDELIKIIFSIDGLWGEMERKSNNNPFFMKCNGNIIRFHGEFAYLEDHINNLILKLIDTKNTK